MSRLDCFQERFNKPSIQDGVVTSAKYYSPHGNASMRSSLFIYAQLFNVDHYRRSIKLSYAHGVTVIDSLVYIFVNW